MSRINVSWATVQPVLATQYFWKGSVVAGANRGPEQRKVAQIIGVGKEAVVNVRGGKLVGVGSSNGRNGCYE